MTAFDHVQKTVLQPVGTIPILHDEGTIEDDHQGVQVVIARILQQDTEIPVENRDLETEDIPIIWQGDSITMTRVSPVSENHFTLLTLTHRFILVESVDMI